MNKLLVADGDIEFRSFIEASILKTWPNSVLVFATSISEALEITKIEMPDLILLNWDIHALKYLKNIQQVYETKAIPVIIYANNRINSFILKLALEEGATDFIRKPFDGVELIARIQSIVKKQQIFKTRINEALDTKQMEVDLLQKEVILVKNDLASLSIVLEQKYAKVRSIVQSIEHLEYKPDSLDVRKKITDVVLQLNQELSLENNWDTIKLKMNGVHSKFLSELIKVHPNLTPNELKLCTLMKLNLSQKEVADILCITVGAVEKARYRLRKKLNLKSGVKLNNYIHSYSGIEN